MNKKILVTGCLLGLIAIILGAFGAHGLKSLVSTESVQSFETGVRYQIYHGLFLLLLGSFKFVGEAAQKTIFYLVVIGVIFFSGSIYGLVTNELTTFDFTSIAIVTPIGGLLLILAWLILLINFLKTNSYKS